VGYERIE